VSLLITNVSFWAISDEGEIESRHLELPFIPGPYVPPEVHIGDQGNIGELLITGLEYVLMQIVVSYRRWRMLEFYHSIFLYLGTTG
jgi:hypothetical protein